MADVEMTDTGSVSSVKRIIKDEDEDSSTSPALVVSIIALVLAVIGLSFAVVSLSRQNANNNYYIGSNSGSAGAYSDNGRLDNGDRIWLIAVGHTASSTLYVDEVSGEIKGFVIDIANAVCRIAGKNCRMVTDVFNRCWDSEPGQTQRGGIGLLGGYYDACAGWGQTYVRARTFQFSNPFSVSTHPAGFLVEPGNPRNFDPQDITNKKIGFVDGFIFDEFCVARQGLQGSPIPNELVVHYQTRDELLAGILSEDVAAGFDSIAGWEKSDSLDVIPGFTAECGLAGQSMMMRKDNTMWQWWNPAFASLRASTEYKLICRDLLDQHGHLPGPSAEEHCFDQ